MKQCFGAIMAVKTNSDKIIQTSGSVVKKKKKNVRKVQTKKKSKKKNMLKV